jgi:hypothetical protein
MKPYYETDAIQNGQWLSRKKWPNDHFSVYPPGYSYCLELLMGKQPGQLFLYYYGIELSRVDRFLQIRQVDVCFLRLPPGFPAVPQYFNHVSVGPGLSQNRTCGFPASGSSNRFTACLLIVELVSVTMFSRALCPALFPLLDTPACQPLPFTGITRLQRYYELIRLPVPHPQTSFPRL